MLPGTRTVLDWFAKYQHEDGLLAKLPWWTEAASPELRRLHRLVKEALDPRRILNPGKFV